MGEELRHHRFYWLNLLPTIISGLFGVGVSSLVLQHWFPMLASLGACFIFWGLGLETRLQCSHCPHYDESEDKIECWALKGYPKLWEYRPGNLNKKERVILFFCYGLVVGIPLLSMFYSIIFILINFTDFSLALLAGLLGLLLVFIVSGIHMLKVKREIFCRECLNFTCNLNKNSQSPGDLKINSD